MPYKINEPRRHRNPKARYKVVNWAEYDAAAAGRQGGRAAGRQGGRVGILDIIIEVGLMLRLAFGRPWRQTEGMLGSIMDLLSLDLAVPDHTMFSRRSVGLGARREGFRGRRVAA
jgi:hypothetical protein